MDDIQRSSLSIYDERDKELVKNDVCVCGWVCSQGRWVHRAAVGGRAESFFFVPSLACHVFFPPHVQADLDPGRGYRTHINPDSSLGSCRLTIPTLYFPLAYLYPSLPYQILSTPTLRWTNIFDWFQLPSIESFISPLRFRSTNFRILLPNLRLASTFSLSFSRPCVIFFNKYRDCIAWCWEVITSLHS